MIMSIKKSISNPHLNDTTFDIIENSRCYISHLVIYLINLIRDEELL